MEDWNMAKNIRLSSTIDVVLVVFGVKELLNNQVLPLAVLILQM
jgi:hypothetical protein